MPQWRALLPSHRSVRHFSLSKIASAGHSKWSNIKDQKFANDAKKGALFTRAQHDISLAIRLGGSANPELNSQLATALKRAREQGVPKENIERTLARATNRANAGGETLFYEALAGNSVGLIIECVSDNVNRTVATVKSILAEHNARMAPVGYMFRKIGLVKVGLQGTDNLETRCEEIALAGMDAGATDFEQRNEGDDLELEFICFPEETSSLKEALSALECRVLSTDVIFSPIEVPELPEDQVQSTADLREALELHDETIRVWTTMDAS